MSRSWKHITDKVVDTTTRMPLLEWNWSEGVALYGLVKLWKKEHDEQLFRFIQQWVKRQLEEGKVFETVNATAPCFSLLELYQYQPEQRVIELIEARVQFLLERALRLKNGALEHTLMETTLRGQMWVDTLFMAGLFLVKAGLLLGNDKAVQEGLNQYFLHVRNLQQDSGLYYHGWDETKSSTIGCLWARGNAWAAIVSVELLDMLPANHEAISRIKEVLVKQCVGLQAVQDLSGLWSTVMNEPETYLETSAAAGIAYAVRKAIRLEKISAEFAVMGEQAARGVLAHVDWYGTLRGVSSGTAVQAHPGEYHVIANDRMEGYGQGLLLMMLSEDAL